MFFPDKPLNSSSGLIIAPSVAVPWYYIPIVLGFNKFRRKILLQAPGSVIPSVKVSTFPSFIINSLNKHAHYLKYLYQIYNTQQFLFENQIHNFDWMSVG